ncbi:hypothetical protein ACMFMF_011967 [Clarireedia jacksonii]
MVSICSITIACQNLLTSMTHSSSRRRRNTSNETDNGLLSSVVFLQEFSSIFFSGSSDLSDHDDSISFLILQKDLQAVDEVSSRKWITTNTNNKRLSQSSLSSLVHRLVRKSS